MRLIGVLMPYAEGDTYAHSLVAAFRAALAKLGWMDGSNLRIELRWGAGDEDRFKSFAKELVDLRPDALLGVSTLATDALAKQTQTIPIGNTFLKPNSVSISGRSYATAVRALISCRL